MKHDARKYTKRTAQLSAAQLSTACLAVIAALGGSGVVQAETPSAIAPSIGIIQGKPPMMAPPHGQTPPIPNMPHIKMDVPKGMPQPMPQHIPGMPQPPMMPNMPGMPKMPEMPNGMPHGMPSDKMIRPGTNMPTIQPPNIQPRAIQPPAFGMPSGTPGKELLPNEMPHPDTLKMPGTIAPPAPMPDAMKRPH